MDTPFVPKESTPKKYGLKIGGAVAFLFLLVVIILAFVAGSNAKGFGWFICGGAMILLLLTTGVLIKWIVADEMEEAKHSYLVGVQCLSLVALAAGMVLAIYHEPLETFVIGGCAGPIVGGTLSLKNGDSDLGIVSVGEGACNGFALANKVGKGSDYGITIESQPDGSYCEIQGAAGGTVSTDVVGSSGIRVACGDAFRIEVSVVSETFDDIVLTNTIEYSPTIQQPADELRVDGPGATSFFNPVVKDATYRVTAASGPTLACTLGGDSAFGTMTKPVRLTLTCTKVAPTPTNAP